MLLEIVGLIVYEVLSLLLSPVFWLVVVVIAFQTNRMAKMKSQFFHTPKEKIFKRTFQSALLGLAGGLISSILLVFLGVSVFEVGIEYLWLTAIILLLFNQRFMCFAYAGGIIALSKYCFGLPQVNIPQLMALVAVLHLAESILILLNSYLKAMPIYTMNRERQLVGGFIMQNFWPLPLVALATTITPILSASAQAEGIIAMPSWWPLLPSENLVHVPFTNVVYALVPVLAALGYSDLALTMTPKEKSRRSSLQLFTYSIILLLLAVLAAKIPPLAILAIVFAPLGHEFLIRFGQKREMEGDYIYTDQEPGAKVLDVLEGYPAEVSGLKSGDLIVGVDDSAITSLAEFKAWQFNPENAQKLLVQRGNEKLSLTLKQGGDLGIILVPERSGLNYLDFNSNSLLKRLLAKLKRKLK